jgi:hypothetical protein
VGSCPLNYSTNAESLYGCAGAGALGSLLSTACLPNPARSRSYVSALSRNSWDGPPGGGCQSRKEGDYQIVVTYRDGNGVWKVRSIAQEYLKSRETSPQEREVGCFIPSFWKSVPRVTRIVHVGFTERGRTVHPPWPPAEMDQPARPALAMDVRLRSDDGDSRTRVEWGAHRSRSFSLLSYDRRMPRSTVQPLSVRPW